MKRILNFLFRISLAIVSWIGAFWSLFMLRDSDVIMGLFFMVVMIACFALGGVFTASAFDKSTEEEEVDITRGGYIIVGVNNKRKKK